MEEEEEGGGRRRGGDKSVWIRLHKDIIRQITTKVSLDPPATHSIRSYMQYESGCQDCRYRTERVQYTIEQLVTQEIKLSCRSYEFKLSCRNL